MNSVGRSRNWTLLVVGLFFAAGAVAVGGCAAQQAYNEGQDLEERGRPYDAAQQYLKALDENDDHKKSREALKKVAKDAYEKKKGEADEHVEDEDYEDAVADYSELKNFMEDVRKQIKLEFEPIDLEDKIVEVKNAGAKQRYDKAVKAQENEEWKKAVKMYRGANKFAAGDEGYKDATKKLAESLYAWGEKLQKANSYRDAAEKFVAAHENVENFRGARKRAAAIYQALGQHYLGEDKCRRAVSDFEQSKELVASPTIDSKIEEGKSCAKRMVTFVPFVTPRARRLGGKPIKKQIPSKIRRKVKEQSTEFINTYFASSVKVDRVQNPHKELPREAMDAKDGTDYAITGKFKTVRYERGRRSSTVETTSGKKPYTCTKEAADGDLYESTCYRDVEVQYQKVSNRNEAVLAGTVRITNVRGEKPRQVGEKTIEIKRDDSAEFAKNFRVRGNRVTISSRKKSSAVKVPDNVHNLSERSREMRSPDKLAEDAVVAFTTKAKDFILDTIDTEGEIDDPSDLTVGTVDENAKLQIPLNGSSNGDALVTLTWK